MNEQLKEIQEALYQFIINATKENAPNYAVQALPEAVNSLVKLWQSTRALR